MILRMRKTEYIRLFTVKTVKQIMRLVGINNGDLLPSDNHQIIDNLPSFIKDACEQFSDQVEKEVLLYSALGVLSGCLPNYIGSYDGKWVSTHIYVFILAPYGTGKGTMTFARYLGSSIHKNKKDRYAAAIAAYYLALKANRKKHSTKKGEDDTDDTTIPEPANEMLYMPADTSKSALADALNDNRGAGIIFETEGDTLAAALKQDYGTYMDILLKAFHHEPITFMRRQNKENKEVVEPRIATVLSSTYDQFLSFIQSAENGLVSRFAYYLLPENREFRNVFESNKALIKSYFEKAGKTVEHKYNSLCVLEKPLTFHFTEDQQEVFTEYFGKAKMDSPGLEGSINRLALITYRIAMIFSYFRYNDYHKGQNAEGYITCYDQDFTNALAISNTFWENAETIHALLPQKRKKRPGDIEDLYAQLTDEFTTKDALAKAMELNIAKRKCERFLEKDDRLDRLSQGKYRKNKN